MTQVYLQQFSRKMTVEEKSLYCSFNFFTSEIKKMRTGCIKKKYLLCANHSKILAGQLLFIS